MEETSLVLLRPEPPARMPTPKDFIAMGFRRRRVLIGTFGSVLVLAALFSVLQLRYESQMKFLVRKQRVDPVVSADQNPGTQIVRDSISDQELNSEIELLKSQDVLRKVVADTGLVSRVRLHPWSKIFAARSTTDQQAATEKAVRQLTGALKVEPLTKSNLIRVAYSSSDPQLAFNVLNSLEKRYLEKHIEVTRANGETEFFDQEVGKYRAALDEAQAKLAAFPQQSGTVAGPLERDITVQKLEDMRITQKQTASAIAETKKRIANLRGSLASTPARMTTQVRTADNPMLLQQLQTTLLNLQLKRTELLQKYQPSYRPVQELEQEITRTKAAIAAAQKSPVKDETTDRDPTYEWVRSELVKSQAELTALEARAAVTQQSVAQLEQSAEQLNRSSIQQQELLREAKTAEDNYQLYLKKREEARITEALNRSRILNVSLAEAPSVPLLPQRSPFLVALVGLALATILAIGAVLVLEYFDKSLRTPDELQRVLGVPVLAALPAPGEAAKTHIAA